VIVMTRQPIRLPTGTRLRAIALVERSLPNPDIEPTAEGRERRRAANTRAVAYAVHDEVSDSLIRAVEAIESMPDGVVVDLSNPADELSVKHHVDQLREALAR
jgi:hypothetical protein